MLFLFGLICAGNFHHLSFLSVAHALISILLFHVPFSLHYYYCWHAALLSSFLSLSCYCSCYDGSFFFALSCPFRFAFCHHSVAPTVLFILTTSNLYNIAWRQRAKITPPTTISCRHHHKLNDNFLILNFMFIFTFWCFSVHISDVFFSLSARSLLVRCMISWQRLIGRRTHKKRNSTKRWIMKTVVFRLLLFAVTNSILHKITHFSDHNNLIIILQNLMEAIPYYIARITVALIYTSRLISPSGYFAAHT